MRWRPGSPTRVLALAVWFVLGAGLVPVAFGEFSLALLGYALLSVTLFRIVPVAVSMVRSSLSRRDVLFVGWFGPRGLASVVFALLVLDRLSASGASASRCRVVSTPSLRASDGRLPNRRSRFAPASASRGAPTRRNPSSAAPHRGHRRWVPRCTFMAPGAAHCRPHVRVRTANGWRCQSPSTRGRRWRV